MIKGVKIKHLESRNVFTVDSILEMEDKTKSVVFTEEGVCLPLNKVEIIEDKKLIPNEKIGEDSLQLEYKFFGCSSAEEKIRENILNDKISLNLFKIKQFNLFGREITIWIDDRTNHLESYHIHVNLRCQFVFRTKNKTYSILIKKSK